MTSVAIAGGGLAGLVAARHLAKAGLDVTVYEADETVGGRVRTREIDGFVMDVGFQVLLDAYPAARRELDYDTLQLRRFPPGAVVCRDGQRSPVVDPLRQPTKLAEALLSRAITVGDKVRTLRLRRELAAEPVEALFDGDDRSIREGLEAYGFSERFVDRFAAPFYGGITLDRSLGSSWNLFRYTFKILAAGRAAVPTTGMEAIPVQLRDAAEAAGAAIHTNTEVTSVAAGTDGVEVEFGGDVIRADAAVVATDPETAADLTGVDGIPTEGRGCLTQYYALPETKELGVGGRILLNADDGRPNLVVPHTEVAPTHAPVGQALLSATFNGDPDEPDDALAAATRERLAEWFPERSFGDLEVVHTERVPFAQFTQPPGFHDDLPDPTDPDGPVVLAGDYTRWSSIQGALESGRQAAWAVESEFD